MVVVRQAQCTLANYIPTLGTKLVPDVAEAHTAALNVTGYLLSNHIAATDEGLNFLLFDVLFSSHYMPIINVCTHQTRVTLPPSVWMCVHVYTSVHKCCTALKIKYPW